MKRKITIEDLIRWDGREPGGVEPKLFVSEATSRGEGLTLLYLCRRNCSDLSLWNYWDYW